MRRQRIRFMVTMLRQNCTVSAGISRQCERSRRALGAPRLLHAMLYPEHYA